MYGKDKRWTGWGVLLVLIAIQIIDPGILLSSTNDEEYAQDLVSMAEQRLAQGKPEEALKLAEMVISEFPDTRAVHKAQEIKELASSQSSETIPLTKSSAVNPPDPGKACLWGLIPGAGQYYIANYYRKAGNRKKAGNQYFLGTGTLIGVPAYSLLALIGLSQSEDPIFDDCCLYGTSSCLVDNQCLANYQNACLIVGIGSMIAVPVLWGGGAYTAWATARRIQKGDTLQSKIPFIK
jgi:hypothetical protein